MPLTVSKLPITARYLLDRSDPEGETWVEFKQARRGQHDRRQSYLDDITYLSQANEMSGIRPNKTTTEVERLEVFMTLIGCNIVDEDGKSYFSFKEIDGVPVINHNAGEFEMLWNALPAEVAGEIVKKCHEHNPQWGSGN